jgi:hypothetical protein
LGYARNKSPDEVSPNKFAILYRTLLRRQYGMATGEEKTNLDFVYEAGYA